MDAVIVIALLVTAIIAAISIGIGLKRKAIVNEFRNSVKVLGNELEFPTVIKLTLGVLRLRVWRTCARGSCWYNTSQQFSEHREIETSSLDLGELCGLIAPIGIVKWAPLGKNVDKATVIMPVATVQYPKKYRGIVIACIDRDQWIGAKKSVALAGEHEGDAVIVNLDLLGNTVSLKGKFTSKLPGQWTYVYDKEKGVYVAQRVTPKRSVKSYKVYLETCLGDLCKKVNLVEAMSDIEMRVELWPRGRDLFIGYLEGEFVVELAEKISSRESVLGLCGDKNRVVLQLNVPFRPDVVVEGDITICPQPGKETSYGRS